MFKTVYKNPIFAEALCVRTQCRKRKVKPKTLVCHFKLWSLNPVQEINILKKESTARFLFTFLIHCCLSWFSPTSPPPLTCTGSGYDYRQCSYISSITEDGVCVHRFQFLTSDWSHTKAGVSGRAPMWRTDSIPASRQIQGQNTHTLNQCYEVRYNIFSSNYYLFYWDSVTIYTCVAWVILDA